MDTPNFTGHSPESYAIEAILSKNAQTFFKSFAKAVNSEEQKELLRQYCQKMKKVLKSKELSSKPEVLKKQFDYALKVWSLDPDLSMEDFKKIWKSHLSLP